MIIVLPLAVVIVLKDESDVTERVVAGENDLYVVKKMTAKCQRLGNTLTPCQRKIHPPLSKAALASKHQ